MYNNDDNKGYGNYPNMHIMALSDTEMKVLVPVIMNPVSFDIALRDWTKLHEEVEKDENFYKSEKLNPALTSTTVSEIMHLTNILNEGVKEGAADNLKSIIPTDLYFISNIYDTNDKHAMTLGLMEITVTFKEKGVKEKIQNFMYKLSNGDVYGAKSALEKLEKIYLENLASDDDEDLTFMVMIFGLSDYAYLNCYFLMKQYCNALDLDAEEFFDTIFDDKYKNMRYTKEWFSENILEGTTPGFDEFDKEFVAYIGLLPAFILASHYNNCLKKEYMYHIINIRDNRDPKYDDCKLLAPYFGYQNSTYMCYLANSTITAAVMFNKYMKAPMDDTIKILEYMRDEFYDPSDKENITEYDAKIKTLSLHIEMCKSENIRFENEDKFVEELTAAMDRSNEAIAKKEKRDKVKKAKENFMKNLNDTNDDIVDIDSDSPIGGSVAINIMNDIINGKELY